MSDDLTNYLMSGSRHASISAESLELMGKQAATMLLKEDIPLNESIAKLAGEHKDINNEQVKRICEFANNAVYLAHHDQNKTASAETSYPQFEIADPSRVIQEMSDGARPTVMTAIDVAYSQIPKAKVSSRDDVLANAFGIDPEKTASLDFSVDTAVKQVMDTKIELTAMKDTLGLKGEEFSTLLKEAQDEFYGLVKQHLMDGGLFTDALAAAQSLDVKKEKVAEAMRPIIERLLTEKVASPTALKHGADQLVKVAHRVVNPEHPMVKSFGAMLELRTEIDKIAMSMESIGEQLKTVNTFIKKELGARQTA